MNDHPAQQPIECQGRCEHCSISEQAERAAADAPLRGRSLAMYAAIYFLGPLVAAIAGAWIGRDDPTRQLLFGTAGLVGGMLGAGLLARRVNRLCGVTS